MRTALVALLAGLAGPPPAEEAWLFFSPDSPDASALAARLSGRRIRPVLVAERFLGRRAPRPAFLATLRAAGDVRVVDPEGLALAERLGIRSLPAVAVRHGSVWHVASGAGADVEELLSCGR